MSTVIGHKVVCHMSYVTSDIIRHVSRVLRHTLYVTRTICWHLLRPSGRRAGRAGRHLQAALHQDRREVRLLLRGLQALGAALGDPRTGETPRSLRGARPAPLPAISEREVTARAHGPELRRTLSESWQRSSLRMDSRQSHRRSRRLLQLIFRV